MLKSKCCFKIRRDCCPFQSTNMVFCCRVCEKPRVPRLFNFACSASSSLSSASSSPRFAGAFLPDSLRGNYILPPMAITDTPDQPRPTLNNPHPHRPSMTSCTNLPLRNECAPNHDGKVPTFARECHLSATPRQHSLVASQPLRLKKTTWQVVSSFLSGHLLLNTTPKGLSSVSLWSSLR